MEVLTWGPEEAPPLRTIRWRSSLRRSQRPVEWVPWRRAVCHSLAQLEISVRTALPRTAVRELLGHEKCSQFQRSSTCMHDFPRLIKIRHLFPPLLGWAPFGRVGSGGWYQSKRVSKKARSPSWSVLNVGSGLQQHFPHDLPHQFLLLFMLGKSLSSPPGFLGLFGV